MDARDSTDATHADPVHRVRSLGEDAARQHPWPDYTMLGIGPSHSAELIRLVGDAELLWDSEGPEAWAPIHAWRALGQLRAEEAIGPLLAALREMAEVDWAMGELPVVFGMIGAAAIPPLESTLRDPNLGLWTRAAAATGLARIAEAHPESRADAVAALTHQLEKWYRTDPELNAMVVWELVELRATEAAPVMGQAFANDAVELGVGGDWEDAQVELGLLPGRVTIRDRPPPLMMPVPFGAGRREEEPRRPRASKTKEKRKLARKARKRNRRR